MRGDVRLFLAGLTLAGATWRVAHGSAGKLVTVLRTDAAGQVALTSAAETPAESPVATGSDSTKRVARSKTSPVQLADGDAESEESEELAIEGPSRTDDPDVSVQSATLKLVAETDPAVTTMTLDDLEAWALEHNPTLSQAEAAVDQERGNYRQAGLYPNPQFGYLNDTTTHTGFRQSNGLFASQEFVTAKKLKLAKEAAAQEIKRLSWDQAAQRMRVLNDLKIRYYEVLGGAASG